MNWKTFNDNYSESIVVALVSFIALFMASDPRLIFPSMWTQRDVGQLVDPSSLPRLNDHVDRHLR